jgi:hypothetical protein
VDHPIAFEVTLCVKMPKDLPIIFLHGASDCGERIRSQSKSTVESSFLPIAAPAAFALAQARPAFSARLASQPPSTLKTKIRVNPTVANKVLASPPYVAGLRLKRKAPAQTKKSFGLHCKISGFREAR